MSAGREATGHCEVVRYRLGIQTGLRLAGVKDRRQGQEGGGELREPGTRQAGQDLECQGKTPGLHPEGHWEPRRVLGSVET